MATTGPKLHQSSYPYYQEKGFSITQIDTYFSIVMAMAENRTRDARTLLRAVFQSEGDEGVQRAEQFKKAFIAHQKMLKGEIDVDEENKRRNIFFQKLKTNLEEELERLSLRQQKVGALPTPEQTESIINNAALEIAANVKNYVSPSGIKYFEGKSVEQIAAFLKDLVISERELNAKIQFIKECRANALENIQKLERAKSAALERLQTEQSQEMATTSATIATSTTHLSRSSQLSTTAAAKSGFLKNQPLSQPRLSSSTISSSSEHSIPQSTSPVTKFQLPSLSSHNVTAAKASAKPASQLPPRNEAGVTADPFSSASDVNYGENVQSKKYPERVYKYYRPKGYNDNEIDTFLSILQHIGEGKVSEAKQLASNLDDSDKAKLARFREDQRTYQELQEKQKADLEEGFRLLSIQEQSIRDAIRENDSRKEAAINKASLEIARNLRNCVFPSGKNHFEGKSLEQIAAFVKDLILTERDLKQKLEAERKTEIKLLEDIQELERIRQHIISKLEAEQSQRASSAATYSTSIRALLSNTPAVAKSSIPKNSTLAQPKMKPAYSSASAASAAKVSSSSRAEYPAPTYHMMASAAAAKPANMPAQAQRASSGSASTTAFTAPVAAAATNTAVPPPRQSATPKLQLPPFPRVNLLKPRASAAQVSASPTSALPSTLAARAAAFSSSTNAATQLDMEAPAPAYLVQAKASAKRAISKPNAKQAPMTAPRPLPPTPCHAMTTRASTISLPEPARNGTRPSK